MTDSHILFSTPMVRALLAGTKTQTRRTLKLPKRTFSGGPIYEHPDMGGWEPTTNGGGGCFTIGKDGARQPRPETIGMWHRTTGVAFDAPHQAGDRLWVRESWRSHAHYDDLAPSEMGGEEPIRYEADGAHQTRGYPAISKLGRYRAARHMPRWASRLTLIVTEVRVQRLQDIGEEDARAEGIAPLPAGRYYCGEDEEGPVTSKSAITAYAWLWNRINGEDAWAANPWVAAYTFTVHPQNIDALPAIKAGGRP